MSNRPAEPADEEALTDIFLAARIQMTYLPAPSANVVRQWIRDVVLGRLDVWVAEDDGPVVGFAALRDDLLGLLYIHPDAQGRGIGTQLLELSKDLRPDGLRLWVFQKNIAARRFYERHGFRLVRLTNGRENQECEPDALYEWQPTGASALTPPSRGSCRLPDRSSAA